MLNKGCHLSQGWIVLRSPQELRDLRAQMAARVLLGCTRVLSVWGEGVGSPCSFLS